MRNLRAIVSAVIVAVLGLGLGLTSTMPAGAAADLPKREIVEEDPNDHQVGFNAFRLKGVVTEPVTDPLTLLVTYVPTAEQRGKLYKKKCQKCRWKVVDKFKTNESGAFKTTIYAPRSGKWKWRVKIDASNGYAATMGKIRTTGFRPS